MKLAAALMLSLLCAPLVEGQSQSSSADLLGEVVTADGTYLPQVEVAAVHSGNGSRRTAFSDDRGQYRILSLVPGKYEVTASLSGFTSKTVEGIVLTVGQYANLDFELDIAATHFTVVVEGRPNIVEREKTVQASTIENRQIDELPINGREFLDFVLLTPGVTTENSLDTTTPVNNPTSGLVFAGQDPRSNYVTIDGVDNMDAAQMSVRPALSQEAVQEFQVSRSNFSAEFGKSRAGLVNIVSKSGGNSFQGDAFFFFRNETLDARNTFATGPGGSPINPPFERHQWGGTLGGPLVKDKTFFFTSLEGLNRDESVFVTFLDDPSIFRSTPSQNELFDALGSTGDPNLVAVSRLFADSESGLLNTNRNTFPETVSLLERESGMFPFEGNSLLFSAKLDHNFSPANRFFGRFNLADALSDNAKLGGLKGVSNGVSVDLHSYSMVFGDTHNFSHRTINDLRFQFFSHRVEIPVNQPQGPEIVISGVAQVGRDFTNPTMYRLPSFQFTDDLSLIRGNHSLKLGVDFSTIRPSGFAEIFVGGQFTFAEALPLAVVIDSVMGAGASDQIALQLSTPEADGGLGRADLAGNLLDPISSVQAFNFGLPVAYFQGFGDPNTSFDFQHLALYLQDEWRVRENLTLNLGVRYDTSWEADRFTLAASTVPFEFTNQFAPDRNDIAPRIGFAFDPTNRGRTVIRGGYGVFFQPLNQSLPFAANVLSKQIRQVFLPITGIPGIGATSVDVWQAFKQSGELDEQTLARFSISPGETPGAIFPNAPDIVSPYSHQVSFGIEQELARDWALDIDYLLNRGLHITRIRDMNVRRTGEDSFQLPGLDPRFLQANLIETTGSSIYHGMTVGLRKRFDRFYSALVSYTLGKAIDDVADYTLPLEPHNHADLRSQRSLSTFDQRHRLVVSGILQSPSSLGYANQFWGRLLSNWTVSPIVTWASGRPFNLLLGFDGNGDGHSSGDRPRLEDGTLSGRNSGEGPSFFSTDLRLSRKLYFSNEKAHISLIIDAFNLFNQVNYSEVNQVIGFHSLANARVSGSEAIPANQPLGFTSAFDPRQVQLGVRISF